MQFLGVMQQELEHQRQLMELMQQMQQQMRQMQQQEQQAHEAQTQQGAPPSGGNERQSQQVIMKRFDKVQVFSGGEEQWQNWSWKIKTAEHGCRSVPARGVWQRSLPSVACKNADGSRCAAGRIIANVEYEKETKGNELQAAHAKEYAVNLEVELQKVCDDILALMDESLILSASTGEPREFCYEMKGDYYDSLLMCRWCRRGKRRRRRRC